MSRMIVLLGKTAIHRPRQDRANLTGTIRGTAPMQLTGFAKQSHRVGKPLEVEATKICEQCVRFTIQFIDCTYTYLYHSI